MAKALAIQLGLKSILLRLLCTLNNTVVSALAQRQIGFKTPWEALVLFLLEFQALLKSLQTSPLNLSRGRAHLEVFPPDFAIYLAS